MQIIVNLAVKLAKLRKKQENFRPYHINLLEQLRCNENSHTRILIELLKYTKNGKYAFLNSFISTMQKINGGKEKISVTKPKILCGKEYLDGYIEDSGYAIIIENKVCGATDQVSQIDRYVTKVSKKIDSSKIFVIYLTSDGKKEVSENSYSQKTQKILGNRFIKMNYKDHIIPWLNKLEVENEPEVKNCVELYINYLEGWFDMDKNDIKEYEDAKKKILAELNVSNKSQGEQFAALLSVHEKIDDLKETVEQSCSEYAESLLNKLKDIFEEIARSLNLKCVDFPKTGGELLNNCAGFGFSRSSWKKCTIRFEFDDNNLKQFLFGIQQNSLKLSTTKIRKSLKEYIHFIENEESSSDWWPWWKMTDEYRTWDETVLHEIMTDSSKFKEFATNKLNEMLEFLKDKNLEQFM